MHGCDLHKYLRDRFWGGSTPTALHPVIQEQCESHTFVDICLLTLLV